MSLIYDAHSDLIGEAASRENRSFESAMSALRAQVQSRSDAVMAYLP